MRKEVKQGRFTLTLNNEHIRLESEQGGLNYSPAEAEKITNLLSIVSAMRDLDVIPSPVTDSPFQIEVGADKTLRLRREGLNKEGPVFSWKELDSLILIVRQGVSILIDKRRHHKRNKRVGFASKDHGQVFET